MSFQVAYDRSPSRGFYKMKLIFNKNITMDINYEQDMQIDESALDVELCDQASLAMRYGRNWAECKQKYELAEENVKVVRSELIREANQDPDKCLGEGVKLTDPKVEAYYRTHKNHIKAKEEWVQLGYELSMAEIAKREICITRKAALENLVVLHGQQYFAGPSAPHDLTELRKEKQKEIKQHKGTMTRSRNK